MLINVESGMKTKSPNYTYPVMSFKLAVTTLKYGYCNGRNHVPFYESISLKQMEYYELLGKLNEREQSYCHRENVPYLLSPEGLT